jgi:hypothetical protein
MLLFFAQCSTGTMPAASLCMPYRFLAISLIGFPPFTHIGGMNADNLSNFGVCTAGLAKSYCLVAQLLLYFWFELACIYLSHTRFYNIKR